MRLDRPFRAAEAIAAGLVTPQQLRGPRFRPLFRGIHVLAEAPPDLEQTVRAALLRHPGAVVVGTTAARWHGVADADPAGCAGPVELVVQGGPRPAPGLVLRRDRLGADEIDEIDDVRLTTPLRTAFDVGRRRGTAEAVVVIESLARGHGITPAAVRGVAGEHPHERGLAALGTALDHVEPGARAGIETPVRLALVAARLPRPVVGHVVVDDRSGLPLGVTDLAWPDLRCALLCDRDDGTAWAMGGGLLDAGWTVQIVDRERFAAAPELTVETTAQTLRRRRREQRRPEDVQAAITASWPSRACRRTVTAWPYPHDPSGSRL